MTFRPLDPETLAQLAAIQKELDAIDDLHRLAPADQLILTAIGVTNAVMDTAKARLEREREAIYQADYDLSRQHRGYRP